MTCGVSMSHQIIGVCLKETSNRLQFTPCLRNICFVCRQCACWGTNVWRRFPSGTDWLYVFGGFISNIFYLNELWIFNCSSTQWKFVSLNVTAGVYSNGAQYPGARYSNSFVAIPKTSLFVMVLAHQ